MYGAVISNFTFFKDQTAATKQKAITTSIAILVVAVSKRKQLI